MATWTALFPIPPSSSSSSSSLPLSPPPAASTTTLSFLPAAPAKPFRPLPNAASLTASLDRALPVLSLREGQAFHARLLHLGLASDPDLSARLIRLYSAHGRLDAARSLLDATPPDLLTPLAFNSLVRAYASSAHPDLSLDLFLRMAASGTAPNEFSFPFALKACSQLGLLDLGRQIHASIVKAGLLVANVFCASALLDLYVKLASLGDASQLFERIPHRNEVTWNSMISAYAQYGIPHEALRLLNEMVGSGCEVEASSWNGIIAGCVRSGDVALSLEMLKEMLLSDLVKPNSATLNTLLPVIPSIPSLHTLKELHGFCIRNVESLQVHPRDVDRLSSAISVGYAFHGCMDYAYHMFEKVELKNSQLLNSMVSGFLDGGMIDKAFEVFRRMAFEYALRAQQVLPKVSLTLLLPDCGPTTKLGLEIHAYVYRRGMESVASVCNALMAMYAKRGDRKLAEKVFERTMEKDVVSWNTIIAMHAGIHDYDSAFDLSQQMLAGGVSLDEYSLSSLLSGCGYCSYFRQAMTLHGHLIKVGLYQSITVVQNSLMDAYGKCGSLRDAQKVFNEIELKDNITWNTIISCFAFSTCPHKAFEHFDEMKEQGWNPNRVTYIAVLSACSHAGLLDEGFRYFNNMIEEHGIFPDIDHYTCIVDNLGRAGQLDRAHQFILAMPIEPDECIWSALLSSCRVHGNVELAEFAAKHLIKLNPQHSGYWVLLSNIYADASRWRDVAKVRAAMKDAGVQKCPGVSWVEVGGSELHKFLTADKLHESVDFIYLALDGLSKQLKDEGYVPLLEAKVIQLEQEFDKTENSDGFGKRVVYSRNIT